jgi:hypothetical protein
MASDKELQGLQIAVAALLSLSVILAVACYFLYSAYAEADARRAAAETRNRPPASAPPGKPR